MNKEGDFKGKQFFTLTKPLPIKKSGLNNKKKHPTTKILIISIIAVILLIFLVLGIIIYNSYNLPRSELQIGAAIEKSLVSQDGQSAYIKLKEGSDEEIEEIQFVFKDEGGNEYFYNTEEGIKEISVPIKKGFINRIFGKRLEGIYDYEIRNEDIGVDDFNNIKEVNIFFKYRTKEGEKIESPVLDTKEIKKEKKSSSRGGGGGGGSSSSTGTCTPSCAGKECGDNGCSGSCGSCNQTSTCSNNTCIKLPDCIKNSDCSHLDGICGIGACNQNKGVCEIHFNNLPELVGYWKFDNLTKFKGDNSSYVYDFSLTKNHGKVVGAQYNPNGKFNGAFNFNGNSGYINVGNQLHC